MLALFALYSVEVKSGIVLNDQPSLFNQYKTLNQSLV